jgi:short-subunit dehydrogenase
MDARPSAVVTGASSGIRRELAMVCATRGSDLIIAADDPAIEEAAERLETGLAIRSSRVA